MSSATATAETPRRRAQRRAPAALDKPLSRSASKEHIFATWAALQLESGNMTQSSVDKYASLWNNWCAWLDSHGKLRPQTACAEDLKRFLDGPAPATSGRRPPLNAQRMSAHTRARYYHLIDSVYSLCLYPGDAAANPCRALTGKSRPSLREGDLQPKLLDKEVFDALRDARQIRATVAISPSQDHRWWLLRDRAILAVLADTGLTASELCALTPRDLGGDGLRLTPAQLALEGMEGEVRVQLENPYTKKGRNLPISTGKTRLLLEWLHRRRSLLQERAARLRRAADRDRYLAEHLDGAPVFFAKPRSNGDMVFTAMRTDSLYYLVHGALGELRRRLGLPDPASARGDGPALIRNSLIQYWVNRHSEAYAAELAGYADEASLRVSRQTQTQGRA